MGRHHRWASGSENAIHRPTLSDKRSRPRPLYFCILSIHLLHTNTVCQKITPDKTGFRPAPERYFHTTYPFWHQRYTYEFLFPCPPGFPLYQTGLACCMFLQIADMSLSLIRNGEVRPILGQCTIPYSRRAWAIRRVGYKTGAHLLYIGADGDSTQHGVQRGSPPSVPAFSRRRLLR